MVQKHSISKANDDDHYFAAIYCYLSKFFVQFRVNCAMISTDDKNEIKVGEPNYPISVLTRKKRVLVAHGQSLQAYHHSFSKVSLVPTVAFSHDIPNTVNESFYRGTPYVYLKAHATEPSSAIRNAKEIPHVLIEKYESKEKVPPMEEEVEFSACANRNDCLTTLSQLGLTDRSTHGTWQFVYQPPHTLLPCPPYFQENELRIEPWAKCNSVHQVCCS